MEALFSGDPIFEEQESAAQRYEKMNDIKKFIGYKLLHSCQDCYHQKDGACYVMTKYNQGAVAVCDLGKCKQWKQRED